MANKVIKQVEFPQIPKSKFNFVQTSNIHDQKFETKPIGYFQDAFRRFCKNKGSVVAAIIIAIIFLFAFLGPVISDYAVDFNDPKLAFRLPKSEVFSFLGWDGCKKTTIDEAKFIKYVAMEKETGENPIKEVYDVHIQERKMGSITYVEKYFDVYLDSYVQEKMQFLTLTNDEYKDIQKYQDEHNVQIIYPIMQEFDAKDPRSIYQYDAALYYSVSEQGMLPIGYFTSKDLSVVPSIDNVSFPLIYVDYNGKDEYTSKMRIEGEGVYSYNYAILKQGHSFKVRVDYNEYFMYKHGEKPLFIFGSDQYGKDIFVRLASGARFSFIFAILISVINLTLGAIYGAIEGYYGGVTDMIMERISDILSGVPFMVVVTLFKLYVAKYVGMVPTLLFAFVATGWIGMASTVRMQFYRYKNQEYVLAARTLGAKDRRIMFKHIFPNSLGTIVTSCVLVIPGVIFSESSLSYLGIVNLSTGNVTSAGTLLANGQPYLSTFPHIIFFPALFISLLEISFNLFGNGLRDAFNPSLRGAED